MAGMGCVDDDGCRVVVGWMDIGRRRKYKEEVRLWGFVLGNVGLGGSRSGSGSERSK